MPLSTDEKLLTLSRDVIAAFDKANGGIHPGFRPAHAKGLLLNVHTRGRSRITDARAAPSAELCPSDGALFRFRRASDRSRQ